MMGFKVGDNIFPLSRNALTQLLIKTSQKYIGKNISTTIIRKIVLSSKFADSNKEKQELEIDMVEDIEMSPAPQRAPEKEPSQPDTKPGKPERKSPTERPSRRPFTPPPTITPGEEPGPKAEDEVEFE